MKSAVVYLPMRQERPGPSGPVLVADIAGPPTAGLLAADLVVADEIHCDGTVWTTHAGPLVASALRRLGIRVHVGPLAADPEWAFAATAAGEQTVALRITAPPAGSAPRRHTSVR
jgi:hypothetical protein